MLEEDTDTCSTRTSANFPLPLKKLPPSSLVGVLLLYGLSCDRRSREDLSFLSEPIAPFAAARRLPRLGLLERLPLRTVPSSPSEKVNSFSLDGVLVPPLLWYPKLRVSPRRSFPARTRLCTARRRCRVAKFLLPSCLDVGLTTNSSSDGGPRGWRIGCSPARPCPGPKVPVAGV